jgi:hypothetical protein
MLIGHYSAAFGLAATRPSVRLWPLMLGVQALDVAWAGLVLAGVEKVQIVPGYLEASDLHLVHMPWTHSLPAAVIWALGLGLLVAWAAKDRAMGLLVGLAVASHWLLDLLVHAPDLLLWPGGPMVGLGLWHSLVLSQMLEVVFLIVCVWLWVWRCHPPKGKAFGLLALMLAIQALSHLPAMAPASPRALALNALGIYLVLALVTWALFDRNAPKAAAR